MCDGISWCTYGHMSSGLIGDWYVMCTCRLCAGAGRAASSDRCELAGQCGGVCDSQTNVRLHQLGSRMMAWRGEWQADERVIDDGYRDSWWLIDDDWLTRYEFAWNSLEQWWGTRWPLGHVPGNDQLMTSDQQVNKVMTRRQWMIHCIIDTCMIRCYVGIHQGIGLPCRYHWHNQYEPEKIIRYL
jgi:hypothetical protein